MRRQLLVLTLLFSHIIISAQITISGTVTDDTMEPLIGATIVISGTELGAATDIDGSFSLIVEELPVTMIVSYLGYLDFEQVVSDTNSLNMSLKDNSVILSSTLCCFCGCYSKSLVAGPSHDVVLNTSGVSAEFDLPQLWGLNPFTKVDATYLFTNGVNDLSLDMAISRTPYLGPVSTSIIGGYKWLSNDRLDLELRRYIIGSRFRYRGFGLALGYTNQSSRIGAESKLNPKNRIGQFTEQVNDGIYANFSKLIFREVFVAGGIVALTDNSEYQLEMSHTLNRIPLRITGKWSKNDWFQSAVFGLIYTIKYY